MATQNVKPVSNAVIRKNSQISRATTRWIDDPCTALASDVFRIKLELKIVFSSKSQYPFLFQTASSRRVKAYGNKSSWKIQRCHATQCLQGRRVSLTMARNGGQIDAFLLTLDRNGLE